MATGQSSEALAARKTALSQQNDSNNQPESNMFMGIDLNQVRYDENGEATYGGLPGSGAVVLNSVGIVPFPKSKNKSPRDPIPVTQEVREVVIKKSNNFGMRLRNFEHGVFVSHVEKKSSAAKAGVRFGDQVLKVGGRSIAGMKGKKVLEYALSLKGSSVSFLIRDRPLERVIELTKDHDGYLGIHIVDGSILSIKPGSSAESNGVILNTQICEVDGINVMGLPDEKISQFIKASESRTFRITVIPGSFYKQLTKRLSKNEFESIHRAKPTPPETKEQS
ncbi:hypothetical protein Aperf_G00000132125 [Anoplocephala perfoliata]